MGVTWREALTILPVTFLALGLVLARWRLNVLALDDATRSSLGSAPARERLALLVASVAATAAVVSVAGVVSWVV